MKLNNGVHKIRFTKGKLYLDEIQIAGEGCVPEKDVVFEFHVDKKEEDKPEFDPKDFNKDPNLLEVNVHDAISGKDLGPGQRR